MKAALPNASLRRICQRLGVSRSALHVAERSPKAPALDEVLAARIHRLIQAHPSFGYRRIWAMLRFRECVRVNRKTVYRILRLRGWFVHQRRVTPRPRVQKRRSRAERSDCLLYTSDAADE